MPMYRKKSDPVHAQQFLLERPWPTGVECVSIKADGTIVVENKVPMRGGRRFWFRVRDYNGLVSDIQPGDWVITNAVGARWVHPDSSFHQWYEEVSIKEALPEEAFTSTIKTVDPFDPKE